MSEIVTSESDAPILLRSFAEEHTEHGLQRVLLAERVDLLELLHESLEILFGARGGKTDDAGESVVLYTSGLVRLEDFDLVNARGFIALLEAELGFIEEAVDVTGAISVLHTAHQCLAQPRLHLFQLLRSFAFLDVVLLEGIAILGALASQNVYNGRAGVKLDGDLLGWAAEVNFTCVLLVVDIFEGNMGN